MAQNTRSASFSLTAVLNGNTYYSSLVLEPNSKSLMQFWDKNTNKITPSWKGDGPKFRMEVFDNEGVKYTPLPETVKLYYNGLELSFGSDGYSTSFNKSFKRTEDSSNKIVTFQIVEDLFSSGNQDNDEIYIKGTIVITGNNTQEVQTPSTAITLVQTASGGAQYYPVLDCGAILPKEDSTTCMLRLFSTATGIEVTQGVTYQFFYAYLSEYKDCSTTEGYSISGNVLTVNKSVVESSETIKGVCTLDGATYIDYGVVVDYNDPVVIGTYITGTNGGSNVMKGETATVGLKLYVDNEDVTNQYTFIPVWTVLKSDGATKFPLPNSNAETVKLTYDQILDSGGTVTGFVSIDDLTKKND